MSFLQDYLNKKRMKKLEDRFEIYKSQPNEYYQTEKLVRTKNGIPAYLIHCTYSEDGQVYSGCIHVLTAKGFYGTLSYTIESPEIIKICAIKHKHRNKGIGTQLLMYLEELARERGINKIICWLSPLYLENHREQLLHFYFKNGYQIAEGNVPNLNIEGLMAAKYLSGD